MKFFVSEPFLNIFTFLLGQDSLEGTESSLGNLGRKILTCYEIIRRARRSGDYAGPLSVIP